MKATAPLFIRASGSGEEAGAAEELLNGGGDQALLAFALAGDELIELRARDHDQFVLLGSRPALLQASRSSRSTRLRMTAPPSFFDTERPRRGPSSPAWPGA